MKVTTRVVIRMRDGKVLSKDSYEYNGPVAECKKGGGSSSTEYVQSPEARQIMNMFMPTIQRIAQAGAPGAPGYVPGGGTLGGGGKGGGVAGAVLPNVLQQMGGGYTGPGGPLWDTTMPAGAMGYDVPSQPGVPNMTLGGLPSEVQKSFMAPYLEGEQRMLQTLGNAGGSAMGGFSGQQAAAVGDYWSKASPAYSQSLFQASQPMWQAQLQQGQQDWAAQLAQQQFGATAGQQEWQAGLQEKKFPFEVIPTMVGEAAPSPVVSSGGGKK